ncbi:hypothetical protein EV138_4180 [Kribbella voronezhensis]|uniref:Uncharacterized protein n=1 Tax=Kribbella voronezhensis TaxID=2512212 RepID=A0A4R7TGG6_9ACTN|nr:hypothetical protein [Kribbella voronezhensis]TDU90588.1 hypothetical protein EV138_4180 [Kribbella voronezhensis]
MDLGPIIDIHTEPVEGVTILFKNVTAYEHRSYIDYHFHGHLAEERARVWADLHGGKYQAKKKGKHHNVKIAKSAS